MPKKNILHIIFSCHTNLKFLSTSANIYVDGTFLHCTHFFKQLFIVHGYKIGHYVPLVFALLTDKVAQSYEHCLQFLTSVCSVIICAYRNTYRFRKDKSSGRFKYLAKCYNLSSDYMHCKMKKICAYICTLFR
jgi:hypothetical protein